MQASTLNALDGLILPMALKDRIKEAMDAAKLSAAALARAANVSPATVTFWLNGQTKSLKAESASEIERATNHRANWLITGKGPKLVQQSPHSSNVIAIHQDDPLPEGFVYIKESSIAFSGGNGRTPHIELIEESDPVAYSISWFQKKRINPETVRRYKVVDHSMEPFLFDGDTVLVNHAETAIKDGKIYAFRYGDDLRIKQLFCRLDGTLILHSINPAHKDEEVSPELVNEHISIIGRVRDKSGGGGL